MVELHVALVPFEREAFPSGLTREAFPSGVTREAFPSGVTREALPSGVTREAFPSGVTREAFPSQVAIVVDVIRASTSLVTLVERGCSPLLVAPSVPAARAAARERSGWLLIGEERSLPPEGFDLGNSPVELSQASVAGRSAVVVTTNGIPAIHAAAGADVVLVGCLRNASAVTAEAWDAAEGSGRITVVCAGRMGDPGGFGLDDAYCAGVLVERLAARGKATLTDAAQAARILAASDQDPLRFFSNTAAGRNVVRLGLGADVAYCAAVDQSRTVPRLGTHLFLAA